MHPSGNTAPLPAAPAFLQGGGEAGAHLRATDWSQHPLGPPAGWPPGLRTAVGMVLQAGGPMLLLWGRDSAWFCNDAYRNGPGRQAGGAWPPPGHAWPHAWPALQPHAEAVLAGSPAARSLRLPAQGGPGEAYWHCHLGPVTDETDRIAGVLVTCTEAAGPAQDMQRLTDSEMRFRTLAENLPDVVSRHDSAFRYTYANARIADYMGRTPAELAGRNFRELGFPAHACDFFEHHIGLVFQTGRPHTVEFRNPFGEGYLHARLTPECAEDGRVQSVLIINTDITERKEAELQARESESRFKNLVEQATVAMCVLEGPEWKLTLVNDPMLNIWQRDRSIVGKNLLDFMPELVGQPFPDLLAAVYRTGQTHSQQDALVMLNRNGRLEKVYMDFSYKALRNTDGTPYALLVAAADMTERYQAKQRLEESENRFRAIANDTPAFIFMGDAAANVAFVNRQWLEFVGLDHAHGTGMAWADVTHPDDVAPMVQTYTAAASTRQPYQFEIRQRSHAGEYRWVLWKGIPRTGTDGAFAGMIGIGIDITDRKQTEQALEQQKRLYEVVTGSTPDLIYVFDLAYRFTYANPALLSMWGKTWQEAIGKGLRENGYEEWHALMHEREIDRVAATRQPVRGTVAFPHATLGERIYDYIFSPVLDGNGEVVAISGTTRDISDIKHAEQSIRESEERFRTLVTSIPQIVWTSDASGRLNYLSRNWEETTGQPIEEAMADTNSMMHPDDRAAVMQSGGEAMALGLPWRHEYRLFHKASGAYRWFAGTMRPVRDQADNILRWVGAATDIQEQKTFTEKLEHTVETRTRELQRSNEDLQQFAHVASHDLKEPLRKIKLFAALLQSGHGSSLPDTGRLYLDKVLHAAARMQSMVDGVLAYSTAGAGGLAVETVDLNEVVAAIRTDLEVLFAEKNARLDAHGLPVLAGSRMLLYQLFYNLVNNALKFSRPQVPPVVVVAAPAAPPGLVEITVSDNGIGFADADATRIFDTFTRLNSKDHYEGTGLGLALCKKIAQRHRGGIRAGGEPGRGAVFTVTLPRLQPGDTI